MQRQTNTNKCGMGFLEIYKERQILQKTGKKGVNIALKRLHSNLLTQKQLAAYNWLVNLSFLQYIDNINKDTFVELILSRKCLCLFRIGKYFGIGVKCPVSAQLYKVTEALRLLFTEFLSKNILEKSVDPELVAGGDRRTVLNLIVSLHQKAMEGAPFAPAHPSIKILNDWIISFGMIPPYGDDWFSQTKLYLVEDPMRNGEVFRNLCYVFRPDIYDGPLPPATDQKEMVERNRQALMVFAEDGFIDSCDVNLCHDIVRGNQNVIITLLEKIYMAYNKRYQKVVALIKNEIQ